MLYPLVNVYYPHTSSSSSAFFSFGNILHWQLSLTDFNLWVSALRKFLFARRTRDICILHEISNFCLTLETFGDFSSIDRNMIQCLVRVSHESRGSEGPMLRVLRLLNASTNLSVIVVTNVSAKVSANSNIDVSEDVSTNTSRCGFCFTIILIDYYLMHLCSWGGLKCQIGVQVGSLSSLRLSKCAFPNFYAHIRAAEIRRG